MYDFNSIDITKKGLKEALAGNLKQAIILFNQASDASFHIKPKSMRIKIGLEILIAQNFCDAINSITEENFVAGNDNYAKYKDYLKNYTDICKTKMNDIPSVGCQYFMEMFDELTNLYRNQIKLLESN